MVKPMKWTAYIKEKVGLSPRHPTSSSSFSTSTSSKSPFAVSPTFPSPVSTQVYSDDAFLSASAPREMDDSESEFKMLWKEFLASKSEKEKEMALKMSLDIFVRIAKERANGVDLIVRLVESHVFSFAIGRAFVTQFEKLRIQSKTKKLQASNVMNFFSAATKGGISHGLNLLYAAEMLVSGVVDKQPLLDSGILCCLIHILKGLLDCDETDRRQPIREELIQPESAHNDDLTQVRQIEVEGIIVHIIKALASHPSAGACLIEDESLQILFLIVANGSMTVFSRYKKGLALVPLHTFQLYRHAMQILQLLLVNNNGSIAKYISRHHLIKELLMAVKDFKIDDDDADYTVDIVDLLLECVELSYRSEAGIISLREDIQNAHGYQFLVHFALKLSQLQGNKALQASCSQSPRNDISVSPSDHPGGLSPYNLAQNVNSERVDGSSIPAPLNRLLDIIVSLSQTGPVESLQFTRTGSSNSISKSTSGHNEITGVDFSSGSSSVQDLEAFQMLQDIFLKTDCVNLQAKVLDRMFRIFLDHINNYIICQKNRVVPLLVINMPGIPSSLQEMILKILEYAVTVVNCVPEQELLSLCCLLLQPVESNLKSSVLRFFLKLLSFDQKYKKVLWDVGLLEVLIDDLLQHNLVVDSCRVNIYSNGLEKKCSTKSFKKYMDDRDAILSSPSLSAPDVPKVNAFEDECTISIAWDCLHDLLMKSEDNQISFRSDDGFNVVLPFLVSDIHRSKVLHLLSSLIVEDKSQVYPEELGTLIEVLKSGVVSSVSGLQHALPNNAKCDILGVLWRILEANTFTKRVFGEATGFTLLLTVLHSFHGEKEIADNYSMKDQMKLATFLLHVITTAVCGSPINRSRLHTILSSQTFCDLLSESSLICVDWEESIVRLLLQLALEIVVPPSVLEVDQVISSDVPESSSGFSYTFLGITGFQRERIYNASAIAVLIRLLLMFTQKVQLELLVFLEKLASTGSFNQESLTSIGCVGLLLDTITPYLTSSSPLLIQALRIVEVLGSYNLSTPELRILVRYIFEKKSLNSGHYLVDTMEKLIQTTDVQSENVSLAPYVEMDLTRVGHASIHVSLGERTWPPASGYTFVCWFHYQKTFENLVKDQKQSNVQNRLHSSGQLLNFFSVGSIDDPKIIYAGLYLQDGVLTLTTSNSFSQSFSDVELEEGRWHHLAVVHSKLNTLTGLLQTNEVQIYLNGKLRHSVKLGYVPSPVVKSLQVTIGTPLLHVKITNLLWRMRCCYLFEEVLTHGSICFMHLLGRGYRGIFQDTNLLQFIPNKACGGDTLSILGSLDAELPMAPNLQKFNGSTKEVNYNKPDQIGVLWDIDILHNLSTQLSGKRLIFAFDGTSSEIYGASGMPSLLNLVDPTSAAASFSGGIPRIGHLNGDSFLCRQCVIGYNIRGIGGVPVILAMVEAAETRDMLHMALALLASALRQNPQNVLDMQACRGYHLLTIFLHHRMSLFDIQSLDIFFQIAACEASSLEATKLQSNNSILPNIEDPEPSHTDDPSRMFSSEFFSIESGGESDVSPVTAKSFSNMSEFETLDLPEEASNCVILSNADMVEHVLLDWTLWVTAPVSIQLALLGFLERILTNPLYRNHNMKLLRQINLVQHLLVTLQRGDVEATVLEKLVVLLSIILEEGFLFSELEAVVMFIITTVDPPELRSEQDLLQETIGMHVTVRNMLLEMLIDLRLGITSEQLLEEWHNVLSMKFVFFFLDEFIHPTSMKWIMTLLGVWLTASPSFAHEFYSNGGYQFLKQVLPSFNNNLEIYYILFCIIFCKPVYPSIPEVSMDDFYSFISIDGCHDDLNFVELMDSVTEMIKYAFHAIKERPLASNKNDRTSSLPSGLLEQQVEKAIDTRVDLEEDNLTNLTTATLMNGDVARLDIATSILRFMVALAKMCPPFSSICRRVGFLENCVDMYFTCTRAAIYADKMEEEFSAASVKGNCLDESDVAQIVQLSLSTSPLQQNHSAETHGGIKKTDQQIIPVNSEDTLLGKNCVNELNLDTKEMQRSIPVSQNLSTDSNLNTENTEEQLTSTKNHLSTTKASHAMPLTSSDSAVGAKKYLSMNVVVPSSSPILALTSWLGSRGITNKTKAQHSAMGVAHGMGSSINEIVASPKERTGTQLPEIGTMISVDAKVLLEIDNSGIEGSQFHAGATVILDFVAGVLADIVLKQLKAVQYVESILEAVPIYVDMDSMLVFQGLCLGRLMKFLERQLLRIDEEDAKKFDKSIWSVNLGALCWIIVDRVYMGAFPQPFGVIKTLDFLLSMLEFSNKDGSIEKIIPSRKGLLSIARGSQQLGTNVHALLKSANRMIMYCFLPSFLVTINETGFVSRLGFKSIPEKLVWRITDDESPIDICAVLQLVISHIHIVLCRNNLDTDLICCLCVNLISLLRDPRQTVSSLAMDIMKYLLWHRRDAIEDLLASKPHQGQNLNILHGGFDQLLTGSSVAFFEWFQRSEETINIVLQQCAGLMWEQYIAGSEKFPGIRIKAMENRHKREMDRKSRDVAKSELKHSEYLSGRRNDLNLIQNSMSSKLRIICQNKYGWLLHAESEWQTHIQQLFHERGIIPTSQQPEWKLCPIEGPCRMRKRLERCKLKVETIKSFLVRGVDIKDRELDKKKNGASFVISKPYPASVLNFLSDNVNGNEFEGAEYDDEFYKSDQYNETSVSSDTGWNGDEVSSVKEESVGLSDSVDGSPRFSISTKTEEIREPYVENKLLENGEYLIRPYLEHLEKVRYKYNCERIVGLDKHDGIFLIGDRCLYIIQNFYVDDSSCICEKKSEDEMSIIDQALGVKKDATSGSDLQSKSPSTSGSASRPLVSGRAWAYSGDAWGKKSMNNCGILSHTWRMWKLENVYELLKRDYQLRPVAIEIFSTDGCNDLLVFHKKERDEVFKSMLSMNLPRNQRPDSTLSGLRKQENNEGSRIFKVMAKSFSKRWQNGEISNFQYLMHLNTLSGRGYSDLTQYPVFPWILADYESETLDLRNPKTFRKLDKPMGCQSAEGEEEFRMRYENWDDPEVPKFHYGSHYSSAGIVLFYLLRLPPFSTENQKLQGGQFDRADRLFNNIRETWKSALGKGNTSDVKELIPEFFYMPEFLENRFNLDLGEKQSGEKVGDVALPPWAKGSSREFIRKHREALESNYVSENLHHWIDLIFGYKQRGEAAEEAVNVFYHYTYEGSVDIDSITDPSEKASILAQINHFGQTPRQLFLKPHVKRQSDRKVLLHPLFYCKYLLPQEVRRFSTSVSQIVRINEKILVAGKNKLFRPITYSEYIAWGFPDQTLRFVSYNDQEKILSTHESLHGTHQLECVGVSHDNQIIVTGADDGSVAAWKISKGGIRGETGQQGLYLLQILCAHTAKITCICVCQPYALLVTGSADCSAIVWDLSGLAFVRQLAEFPTPVSAIHINDLTGEIVTAAGILLVIWGINGDCLAAINASQLPSDLIISITTATFSDWQHANWYVTGHQSGAVKIWSMVHHTLPEASSGNKGFTDCAEDFHLGSQAQEYRLVLQRVLRAHEHPVTALHVTSDLKQLLTGDSAGCLFSWTLPEDCERILSDR